MDNDNFICPQHGCHTLNISDFQNVNYTIILKIELLKLKFKEITNIQNENTKLE